jgi:serine/threonine protein phosphatase PrpC
MPTTRLKFGLRSDVGGKDNNKDSALAMLLCAELTGDPPSIGLFVVADGPGPDGKHISSITVRTLAQYVLKEVIAPQLEERGLNGDQKTIPEILSGAVAAVARLVQEQAPGNWAQTTCAVIQGNLVSIANIGTTRAYLFANDHLEVVTHNPFHEAEMKALMAQMKLNYEQLPGKRILYTFPINSIGVGKPAEIENETRRLPPSARLLLCTDGLWKPIGDEGIKSILQDCADPQEACDRLVAAANARRMDNNTAVLVQMPD